MRTDVKRRFPWVMSKWVDGAPWNLSEWHCMLEAPVLTLTWDERGPYVHTVVWLLEEATPLRKLCEWALYVYFPRVPHWVAECVSRSGTNIKTCNNPFDFRWGRYCDSSLSITESIVGVKENPRKPKTSFVWRVMFNIIRVYTTMNALLSGTYPGENSFPRP